MLISTAKFPAKVTPGTVSETVPLMEPAMPAGESRKKPPALATRTASPPRLRLTPLAATRIDPAEAPVVTLSKAKLPRSTWPRTLSSMFSAEKDVTFIAVGK